MRPVNLIPGSLQRRQERHSTGIAPYVVIAALVVLVFGLLGHVLVTNKVTDKRAQLAELSVQLEQLQQESAALAAYGKFATLKQVRLAGVETIATARFPWSHVLLDVAKTLPKNVWLINATGKVSKVAKTGEKSNSANAPAGGGSPIGGNKQQLDVPGPTLELTGCTYRQHDLATMMTRLRNIDQVAQVLLNSSEEKDEGDADSEEGTATSGSECRTRLGIHKFVVTLTFPPGAATALVGTGTGPSLPAGPKSSQDQSSTTPNSNAQPVSAQAPGGATP